MYKIEEDGIGNLGFLWFLVLGKRERERERERENTCVNFIELLEYLFTIAMKYLYTK